MNVFLTNCEADIWLLQISESALPDWGKRWVVRCSLCLMYSIRTNLDKEIIAPKRPTTGPFGYFRYESSSRAFAKSGLHRTFNGRTLLSYMTDASRYASDCISFMDQDTTNVYPQAILQEGQESKTKFRCIFSTVVLSNNHKARVAVFTTLLLRLIKDSPYFVLYNLRRAGNPLGVQQAQLFAMVTLSCPDSPQDKPINYSSVQSTIPRSQHQEERFSEEYRVISGMDKRVPRSQSESGQPAATAGFVAYPPQQLSVALLKVERCKGYYQDEGSKASGQSRQLLSSELADLMLEYILVSSDSYTRRKWLGSLVVQTLSLTRLYSTKSGTPE